MGHTEKKLVVDYKARQGGHTMDSDLPKPYTEAHGGADGPEIGLFQGNGDLYTSFWNGPDELTWSVGKTDVWDRRYFGDSKRVVTLEEIRLLAFHGDITQIGNRNPGLPGSAHALVRAYDFPCPKPVGQIILRNPDLEKANDYIAELDMDNGVLHIKVVKNNARLNIDGFVSAVRNVMVFRASYSNLSRPIHFELYRHRDTLERGKTVMGISGSYSPFEYDYNQDPGNGPIDAPEAGSEGKFLWIRQRFPADMTFPKGFEVVMMAMIPKADYKVVVHENVLGAGAKVPLRQIPPEELKTWHGASKEKRLAIEMVNNAPGWLASAQIDPSASTSFTAYVSVMTTRDALDPFSAARKELVLSIEAGMPRLLNEHRKWWKMHWNRSSVKTTDLAFDQALFSQIYLLGWSARSGKVPISNIGQYLFTDAIPWHGDYHFNEIWLHPIIILNHAPELLSLLEMMEEMLPMAQANAHEVYGCRGCCYPLIHYPIKSKRIVYSNQVWELGMELTAMVLKPFWHYYKFTGELDYLRKHAYPMMREGARFYTDYVQKGKDGFYHIIPTVSQENWGLTKNFEKNRDSVGALSQVRYHLLACVEAAEQLGLDVEEKERWREIARNMAPYPTYMTDEGPLFVDVRDNKPCPTLILFADLSMVFWGDQIHLESDPAQLEIARRTFKKMYIENKMFEFGKRGGHPYYYRSIERRLGMERTINYFDVEDLLMSFTGCMYLFIGVPEKQDTRFERLLAWGGFEVSAEKKSGNVSFVQFKSLGGAPCRIKNPWQSSSIVVTQLSNKQEIAIKIEKDTNTIRFLTEVNEEYILAEAK